MARHSARAAIGLVLLAVLPAACTLIFGDYEVRGSTGTGGAGTGGADSSSSTTTSSSSSSTSSTTTSSSTSSTTTSSSTSSSSTSSTTSSSSSTTSSSSTSSSSGGPACGDGKKDPGEDCDDGNTKPADGCSPTCKFENADTCPGVDITLTSLGLTVTGSTQGASPDTGELPCGGASAGDLVYRITAAQTGQLYATLTGNFQTLLYARSACPGQSGNNVACASTHNPAIISLPLQAGESVYLFVDGYGANGQEGNFTLTLELN